MEQQRSYKYPPKMTFSYLHYVRYKGSYKHVIQLDVFIF